MQPVFLFLTLILFFALINVNCNYYNFREKIRHDLERNEFEYDDRNLRFLKARSCSEQWEIYRKTYDKNYKDEHDEQRHEEAFKEACRRIENNQKKYVKGERTYILGFNKFADMTKAEFQAKYLRVGAVEQKNYTVAVREINVSNVTEGPGLDLRVSQIPVKDQGPCGSCWAFASVAVLEYSIYQRHNQYYALSEQIAMDCARHDGCNGGWPQDVYEYYMRRGLPLENDFPYTAENEKCQNFRKRYYKRNQLTKFGRRNGAKKWYVLRPNTEESIIYSLHNFGWVSVCVNANSWQFYLGGVMRDNGTDPSGPNHAVTCVGYGIDKPTGLKYWLIRNSWGTDWGENGHIRIERGNNAFHICSEPKGSCYVDY